MYEEQWKDIQEYEGSYQVSNLGNVKSLARVVVCLDGRRIPIREKILKNSMSDQGYHRVSFSTNSIKIDYLVHRLVMATFVTPSDLHVNHKDGVRTNNKIDNLEYCTQLENNNHQQTKLKNRIKYGVWFHTKYNRWRATLGIKGKHKYLGTFEKKEEAHQAFFNAYLEYHGVAPWEGDYRKLEKKRFGVTLDKRDNKFQAAIRIDKKTKSLGRSSCKEEAYQKVYNAHLEHHGVAPW